MMAILASLAAVPAFGGSATTYYLSSISGDDGFRGTDPSQPWKSLAKLQSVKLVQGDSVMLERGAVWVDETLVVDGLNQGTLGAYGSDVLPRPAIWRSRSAVLDPHATIAAAESLCVVCYDATDAVITGLHLAGCFRGLDIYYTKPGGRNLMLRNNSFADIKVPFGAIEPSLGVWGKAITVSGTQQNKFSNLTVTNNIAIRVDVFVDIQNSVDGLYLDANTVARCGGNCVFLGASNMHLSRSVFLRDTPEQLFLYGTTDVIIGTVDGNNSITDTDFNTRGEYQAGPDGCAVDFETSASVPVHPPFSLMRLNGVVVLGTYQIATK